MSHDRACPFCVEFGRDDHCRDELAVQGDRLICGDADLAVFPSVGPLSWAHLLVSPRRHVTSFSDLRPREASRAQTLVDTVTSELRTAGSHAICFEHGMGGSAGSGGCGIAHAHLHLVAVADADRLRTPPAGRDLSWESLPPDRWLLGLPTGQDYLLYVNGAGIASAAILKEPIPSQFMRRWAAGLLGHGQWDWRAADDGAQVFRMAEELRGRLPSTRRVIGVA